MHRSFSVMLLLMQLVQCRAKWKKLSLQDLTGGGQVAAEALQAEAIDAESIFEVATIRAMHLS